ncbi:MAG: FixH family protein [Betaproteobacteria bacterium]
MHSLTDAAPSPWYRQRWPWFLMLGPALVLVAGAYTMWLAYKTDDGLVARDYYKRGLLINRTLQRDHNAAAMGIAAQGTWNAEGTSFALRISGTDVEPRSPVLHIIAGKSEVQTSLPLAPIGGGWYEAPATRPAGHAWRAVLETEDWRLTTAPTAPGAPVQFVAADP